MAALERPAAAADPDAYGPAGRSAWMDVDWREHQRWLLVDGHPVNLVDLGPARDTGARPMLFVHGLSGSWQNFLENLPFFAGDHRVLAVDLPGFGATPMRDGGVSIPAYARLLAQLLDALEEPCACVVGNSMGGFVALELAASAPERVTALVLVSPAGLDARAQRHESVLAALRRAERLLIASGTMLATHADVVARRARLRRATMHMAVRHPHRLPSALMAEQIRQGSGKPGFVEAVDALTAHDIEDRLGSIGCPTLVYWGDSDRLVPVRHAARVVAGIPGAHGVILADTGHMAMLERPARFNADVDAFLAGRAVGVDAGALDEDGGPTPG